MPRIALLDDYQHIARASADWSRLPASATVEVFTDHLDDEAAVAERLRPFEIVMALRERTPFPRSLLERLPNLRLIATAGRRNAAIDVAAATELGIVVCGTAGSGTRTMELTWGLILTLTRRIREGDRALREGDWQRPDAVGFDLAGKTLGTLGLGNLGSATARVGLAFGMRVIAWSQNLTPERAAEVGVERVDKAALLARSDVLTINTLLSARTRGIVGAAELTAMKPTALLVNTSRGPIVDEAALVEALRRGTIAGAGLDVYDREPLPADHPLRSLPNTVLTPHLGGFTREGYAVFYGEVLTAIERYLAGTPERVLNPEVLPRRRGA